MAYALSNFFTLRNAAIAATLALGACKTTGDDTTLQSAPALQAGQWSVNKTTIVAGKFEGRQAITVRNETGEIEMQLIGVEVTRNGFAPANGAPKVVLAMSADVAKRLDKRSLLARMYAARVVLSTDNTFSNPSSQYETRITQGPRAQIVGQLVAALGKAAEINATCNAISQAKTDAASFQELAIAGGWAGTSPSVQTTVSYNAEALNQLGIQYNAAADKTVRAMIANLQGCAVFGKPLQAVMTKRSEQTRKPVAGFVSAHTPIQ